MICPSDILNIKEKLDQNIGQKVMVRRAIGRKRFLEEEAVIENTYKYFFNVKNEEKEANDSYQYENLFTNDVQISIFNGKEYFPLIPTTIKSKF